MLDTHQLNVFLIAAETLSFTQAAYRLHMSQPSVSQHIQSLEQYFGMPLFLRSGRYIELTDAGKALLPLAREMVNRSIQLEETMRSLQGEVYGHLLVGCSTTPGKYILPQLLASFHRRYARVTLACQVSPQAQALQMVSEGAVHFALASAPHLPLQNAEIKRFMTDEIMLIAPLDHPWALRGEIEAEELYDAPYIFREETSGTWTAVRQELAAAGIASEQMETLLILGNSEAIALAVQEGLGCGFVSSIVVTRLVQGRVAPIQVRGLTFARDIYFCRHTGRPSSVAQIAFWEFINEQGRASFLEREVEPAAL